MKPFLWPTDIYANNNAGLIGYGLIHLVERGMAAIMRLRKNVRAIMSRLLDNQRTAAKKRW